MAGQGGRVDGRVGGTISPRFDVGDGNVFEAARLSRAAMRRIVGSPAEANEINVGDEILITRLAMVQVSLLMANA